MKIQEWKLLPWNERLKLIIEHKIPRNGMMLSTDGVVQDDGVLEEDIIHLDTPYEPTRETLVTSAAATSEGNVQPGSVSEPKRRGRSKKQGDSAQAPLIDGAPGIG